MAKQYAVAFYEIDLAYGGPEEGGWWYRTHEYRRMLALCTNKDAAWSIANRANRLLDIVQRGLPSLSSATYRGGRYSAEVIEGLPPEYIPAVKPRYE